MLLAQLRCHHRCAALAAGVFLTVSCNAECIDAISATAAPSGSMHCPDSDGEIASHGLLFSVSPSLVKCLGATIAGSVVAAVCILLEGGRTRARRAVPDTNQAQSALALTFPCQSETESRTAKSAAAAQAASKRIGEAPLASEDSGNRATFCSPNSGNTSERRCRAAVRPRPLGNRGTDSPASRAVSSYTRPPQKTLSSPADLAVSWRPQASPTSVKSAASSHLSFGAKDLSEFGQAERQVKSILNKITREKFDTLYHQLHGCCVSCPQRTDIIQVIAREVFLKATTQHNFIEMYAELCFKLEEDLLRGGIDLNFRRALLTQCQESFNLHLEPPQVDISLDYEEQYEVLVKYKTKMLGNVKLIGHLLRQRMLAQKVIVQCTDDLIAIGTAEALETLCAFLETIGSTFDKGKLDEVFSRLELFTEDSQQTPRIKCIIKDLLAKRAQQWQSVAPEVKEIPLRRTQSQDDPFLQRTKSVRMSPQPAYARRGRAA